MNVNLYDIEAEYVYTPHFVLRHQNATDAHFPANFLPRGAIVESVKIKHPQWHNKDSG